MNPLNRILAWWQSLAECPREWIAVDICRCLAVTETEDFTFQCSRFLDELLTITRHLGRTLAVRAVIDYYFERELLDDADRSQLEMVETGDAKLRSLANAALGRRLQSAAGRAHARDTWKKLREAELSDNALVVWERAALIHWLLP